MENEQYDCKIEVIIKPHTVMYLVFTINGNIEHFARNTRGKMRHTLHQQHQQCSAVLYFHIKNLY